MKHHTSRWVEAELYRRWELREKGEVLATIIVMGNGYGWKLGAGEFGTFEWCASRYAAQRQARKALQEQPTAAARGAAARGETG